MALVCNQIDMTTNECLQWVEMPQIMPKLTLVEGNTIGFACLMVFATVFIIKKCIQALN